MCHTQDVPIRRKVRFWRWEMPVPANPLVRRSLGFALVFMGLFGMLPILGFWMIPLGLLVLAVDYPPLERRVRRFEAWTRRKFGRGRRR